MGDEIRKDMDYYLEPEHAEEWKALTNDEQGAVFNAEGDTFVSSPLEQDEEVKPAAIKADEDTAGTEVDGKTGEDKKPVIQAKDGENVIPYERLEEATAKVKESQGVIDRLEQSLTEQAKLVADLQEAAKQDAAATEETGEETTAAIDAVKAEYEGGYPEMMEDIKPYFEKLIQVGSTDVIKGLKDEITALKEELAPVKETVEQDRIAAEQDDKADWQSAIGVFFDVEENKVFSKDSNPMLYNILDQEVIRLANSDQLFADYPELLDAAKQNVKAGMPGLFPDKEETPAKTDVDLQAEADKKLAELKEKPPTSLTDVPGSSAVHHDEVEAAEHMTMRTATHKFANMDTDQQEDYFTKVGL